MRRRGRGTWPWPQPWWWRKIAVPLLTPLATRTPAACGHLLGPGLRIMAAGELRRLLDWLSRPAWGTEYSQLAHRRR